ILGKMKTLALGDLVLNISRGVLVQEHMKHQLLVQDEPILLVGVTVKLAHRGECSKPLLAIYTWWTAAHDAMFSIFIGTPGGQPMTPGGADLDIMSPGVGGDDDESWFLPDILVNVRGSGDDALVSSEKCFWFCLVCIRNEEPIPSTPYDPLVLRHAFEKDLDQEKQITASTFMKILNLLLAIGTGSYPFSDPHENDIEIDGPVLVVPTSSHTKRKEEIGGDDDGTCFLPDILVNVRRSGDDAALGVIREVLLDLDREKQITTSTFMKILNLLLAIGTGSYPFSDPLENDIEIDGPVLVVPTSSHTKRKEEIASALEQEIVFWHLEDQDRRVTLSDGTVKEGKKWETTPFDIAKELSNSLASNAMISRVDGVLWDMSRPLESDCQLKIFTFDSDEGRDTFWHSSSRTDIRMQVVYWTMYYLWRAVAEKQRFERIEVSREQALEMFSNNKFKVEIISELPEDKTITVYRCGRLVDVCRGPHIPNTAFVKAIACLKASAAYSRGNKDRESLQRVYGISYPDQKRLKEYIAMLEEAKKYDHRELGKKQELFFFHPLSPGSCFFLPHGTRITEKLKTFIRTEYRKRGYQEPELDSTPVRVQEARYSDWAVV
nr:threonine--tRNA ligase, mitochondrial 1 [Tanacetum cinerariifolium]